MEIGIARGKGAHPWVQVIAVDKVGSHLATIECAARASLAVRLQAGLSGEELTSFSEWLSGPFTKSVRRGSRSQLEKARSWAETHGVSYAEETADDSYALAFVPIRYEQMPKVLASLQVNGTDFPRLDGLAQENKFIVVDETLSTGKACAQAAHAAWLYALDLDIQSMGELGRFHIMTAPASTLRGAAEEYPGYAVRDNGLTEVQPNTLTAVMSLEPQ